MRGTDVAQVDTQPPVNRRLKESAGGPAWPVDWAKAHGQGEGFAPFIPFFLICFQFPFSVLHLVGTPNDFCFEQNLAHNFNTVS